MFDVDACLDELRRRATTSLLAERDQVVSEQRRLRVRELALTRVLDERGAIDDSFSARDGVTVRRVRETVECARALASLPRVAAAAHAGALSGDQLAAVTRLADAATDAEWAVRAPNVAPADLARLARAARPPSAEEGQARREARSLQMWWQRDRGMLAIRGELPDLDGARFEATVTRMVDRMRPAKGEAWDSREHRAADALVELCERFEHAESPTARVRPLLVVEVPVHGPAEVAGIPLPAALVESLRAGAAIEPALVDDGRAIRRGARSAALSPKLTRAVLLRDGHCRWPGCERRTGLQVHHLVPRSWGGSDEIGNLAAVCVGGGTDHHAQLVPHGPLVLTGDPNLPDGLRLERPGATGAKSGDREPSAREAGIPPRSEAGPERPGAAGAESGNREPSAREAGIPPRSEAGPERPGATGAESGSQVKRRMPTLATRPMQASVAMIDEPP